MPASAMRSVAGSADINSGADANADAAFDFERDQRFAHRRPRHFQLLGDIALGRKPEPTAYSPLSIKARS